MLTRVFHQRHYNISFENCHFYSQKIHRTCVYCIHVGVFRYMYLISDRCPLTSYTSMTLIKMVSNAFSFEILILFKTMKLSTMSLDNLTLKAVLIR